MIDLSILSKAMAKLGYRMRDGAFYDNLGNKVEFVNGELRSAMRFGKTFDCEALNDAYATAIVETAVEEYGWSLTETEPGKYAIQKGYD